MSKKKKSVRNMKAPDAAMLEQNSGGRRLIGKVYGQSLGMFVRNLLEMNEVNPRSKKWHDGQIALAIVKEYAAYPDSIKKYDVKSTDSKKVRANIALLRAEYNAGKLVSKTGPAKGQQYSFQYDDKGNAINAKTKDYSPLSMESIKKRRKKADERFEKWQKNQ